MNKVKAVYFANIPNNKSKEELIVEFKRIWPHVFADNVNFTVNLYSTRNARGFEVSKVVVTGVNADLDEMKKIGRQNKIYGSNIIIKKDIGEARNSDGSFIAKKRGFEMRMEYQRYGITQKKVIDVFQSDFNESIGFQRLNLAKRDLVINPSSVPQSLLHKAGNFINFGGSPNLSVKYDTVIEAMQAVSFLNNRDFTNGSIRFLPSISSTRTRALGKSGFINVAEIIQKYGYIPFREFDPTILDWNKINKGISSLCWKCRKSYQFIGVDQDLNYLAGVCICSYDTSCTDKEKRAFKWEVDRGFTRLMADGRLNENHSLESVTILHEPMKMQYSTPKEYARIVLPILQEEWMYSARSFRSSYKCFGSITSFKLIETIGENDESRDMYALEVLVDSNSSWNLSSKDAVKELRLQMKVMRNGKEVDTVVRGKLHRIRLSESEKLELCIAVCLSDGVTPAQRNPNVAVSPLADKLEYSTIVDIVEKFAEEADDVNLEHPFLKLLIQHDENPTTDWFLCPMRQPPTDLDLCRLTTEINSSLHENQLLAKKIAVSHSLSYIQGPPGTGKTQTAVAIILNLSIREPGMIVVTAASNEACNCLAERIWDMSQQLGITPSVVRMMSSSKEIWDDVEERVSTKFPLLDELVRRDATFFSPDLESVFELIKRKDEHMMTVEDRTDFNAHISDMEEKILKQQKIVICTLGSLSDKRLIKISKECNVSTVVIEEAGHITQPQSLPVLLLKPTRIIMIGDHLQLPPTIQSKSAARAGLGDSPLLLASNNYNRLNNEPMALTPGWTTLTEQHRMIKPIRELVSDLTYRGLLTDAPAIRTREPEILHEHLSFFPELQDHSIVLIDEQGRESQVGTSYSNFSEATCIATTVTKLLKGHTPSHKITVLTLYEAQKRQIMLQLEKEKLKNPEIQGYSEIGVFNVDAYQGRENSLVIVSFVRSNISGDIGFVREPNRVNVALSRARDKLVIVCNLQMFKAFKSQVWSTFIRKVNNLASIIQSPI